jgi:hypothetical protein
VTPILRLAQACVTVTARRWPEELSEGLAREWRAELRALGEDAAPGSFLRSWRAISFATSLLVSPAVEPAGAPQRTWRQHANRSGRALTAMALAACVPLLAAAVFNAVHVSNHALGPLTSPLTRMIANSGLLVAAAAAMWLFGGIVAERGRIPWSGRPAAVAFGCTVPVGLAMFAFLLAGNRVAVMPFMGWLDLAPGIAAWIVLTSATIRLALRSVTPGRHWPALVIGAVGTFVALDGAAIAASFHAASTLGVGAGWAPAWFPLALMPGGTTSFGPFFGDGTAAFGHLRQAGPPFHASDILLGNVAATMGPLLLCSVFLIAYATRGTAAAQAEQTRARHRYGSRVVAVFAAGVILAAGAIGAYPAVHGFDPSAVLARIEDNSAVFGFGFASHLPGRVALVVLFGLALARLTDAAFGAPTPAVARPPELGPTD